MTKLKIFCTLPNHCAVTGLVELNTFYIIDDVVTTWQQNMQYTNCQFV